MAICPNCTYDSPAGMKFCGQCGTPLPAGTPVQPERRVLTVMFCDLVGSTTLSEGLDPEDVHAILQLCHGTWRALVESHGGHVAQFLGDGLLAYFGFPKSREDDASRAVRAGLRIVEVMPSLRRRVGVRTPVPLEVRVGIHTGPVVVGEIGDGARREQLAMGTTPNLAARLQGLAEPGSLVISETTGRLVSPGFVCRELGARQLKGFSQPLEVFQVLREGDSSQSEDPRALVGRRTEMGRLLEGWRRAREGDGRMVLVQGEAGVGKSRLVRQLVGEIAAEPHTVAEGHCSPFYQNTAYHPLAELVRKLLGMAPSGSGPEQLARLEERLASWGFDPAEHLPLWARLLSLDPGSAYALPDLNPPQLKGRLLASLVAGFSEVARRQPLLLIVQDLHWVDPSTVEALTQIAAHRAGSRVMVLVTARPGFEPPWPETERIVLSRLEAAEIEALVRQTAAGRELPAGMLEHLVKRAEGVPLYAEELTKMVLESGLPKPGTGTLATLSRTPAQPGVPTTLQSSIEARLDRLGGAKRIAQTASVLGEQVDARLLRALLPGDENLDRYLLRLAEAEILVWLGGSTYAFKHALIRDAVYESLLRKVRPGHHRSVVKALEEGFPEVVETRPELLAQHCVAGELVAPAIVYWQKASQRAAERSADLEASRHLAQALELLEQLPQGEGRDRLELSLRTALGPTLMALNGYAAPEVEAVYRRALVLCDALKPTPHQFPVLLGLTRIHHVRADLIIARVLGEELVQTAEEEGGAVQQMVAHLNLGVTLFHLADLERSARHLNRSVELADAAGTIPQALRYGTNPAFHGRAYQSYALWSLGLPDQALNRIGEAFERARQLGDPMSLSIALNASAMVRQFRREAAEAARLAAEAMEVAGEAGLLQLVALARTLHGWGLAYQGLAPDPAAVEEVHRGVIDWVSTGTGVAQTYFLALLAELQARLGEREEAMSILIRAEELSSSSGEAFYLPEIHRLQGELALAAGERMKAEASLRRACQIAHAQGSRSLYLRAATDLALLWREVGRESEARKLLGRAFERFEEGVGTRDFAGASTLLADLAMTATR